MAPGMATPLASIKTRSGGGLSWLKSISAAIKSLPKLQHTQPPARLIKLSSRAMIRSSSMGRAPNSLTKTARRRPLAVRSRWLTKVVLPAPR